MPEPMDLEAILTALPDQMTWPATPDLRVRVRGRLIASRPWYGSRWALAAVAVLVIIATLVAYTPTRTAIADWVNLHTSIRRTSQLPTPSPLKPGALGARLGLGPQTTLDAAQAKLRWPVLVPSALGKPGEVYLEPADEAPAEGEVSLVYGPQAGIPIAGQTGVSVLITEARGKVDQIFFGKVVGDGTTVEPVTIAGHSAWWISGSPHVFFFEDASGEARLETMRLATNTLVIDVNGTIVRIEGDMTLQQATGIAESLQ